MKMRMERGVLLTGMVIALCAGLPLAAQNDEKPKRAAFLMAGGSRSFLGVGVVEVTPDRAKALRLSDEHGVEITKVDEESPAAKAGLKAQDVVLEYNGQRIEGVEQFIRFVRETPSGRAVKLQVNRGGQAMTVSPVLESRKMRMIDIGDTHIAVPEIPEIPEIRIPDIPRPPMAWRTATLGIEAESLPEQLAEYFGVREGVLVRSVSKGSPAEKAGLKAGDVIVRVGDKAVASPTEVSRAVRAADGASVALTLVRDRKQMSLSVTPAQESGTGRPRGRAVRLQEQ